MLLLSGGLRFAATTGYFLIAFQAEAITFWYLILAMTEGEDFYVNTEVLASCRLLTSASEN